MEYSKIIAITGLPGLFELISSKSDGGIVRSLDDQSTKFVSSRVHQFSHLESIEVYTTRHNVNLVDVLKAMEADAGILIKELRVDGGATANNLLMQFQADLLNCKVIRPEITETTALGAAYLAGLAIGFWKDSTEISQWWKSEKEFLPSASNAVMQAGIDSWKQAVRTAQVWSKK